MKSIFYVKNVQKAILKKWELHKSIESFRIVFRNVKLNNGSVKSKNLSQGGVNLPADGFGIINHLLKHEFNVICKI